jgi:c-di-GMP-binding flagellar brake protein YcgR
MKSDTRSFPRKILRCAVIVAVPGAAPMRGRVLDISLGGISVIVPEQLRAGLGCGVDFEAPLNGKPVRVTATVKVIYSILGADGFRVGLEFQNLDPTNHKHVAELTM